MSPAYLSAESNSHGDEKMSAPAHQAAIGNLAGMMVIGAGAVSLAQGIFDGLDAARDARFNRAYTDALQGARAHASEMESMALVAVRQIAELEAEVLALRKACQQRQDVINVLKARR